MPIYDSSCTNCKTEHEIIQKVSDNPVENCPNCEENSLIKKTSQTAFHLKGGGWYKDGYSAPANSNKASKSENGKKANSSPKKGSSKAS